MPPRVAGTQSQSRWPIKDTYMPPRPWGPRPPPAVAEQSPARAAAGGGDGGQTAVPPGPAPRSQEIKPARNRNAGAWPTAVGGDSGEPDRRQTPTIVQPRPPCPAAPAWGQCESAGGLPNEFPQALIRGLPVLRRSYRCGGSLSNHHEDRRGRTRGHRHRATQPEGRLLGRGTEPDTHAEAGESQGHGGDWRTSTRQGGSW